MRTVHAYRPTNACKVGENSEGTLDDDQLVWCGGCGVRACITWQTRAMPVGLRLQIMASTQLHRNYDSIHHRQLLEVD